MESRSLFTAKDKALAGCRDMLREAAKQFRQKNDTGHAVMCDRHADEADKHLVINARLKSDLTAEQVGGGKTVRVHYPDTTVTEFICTHIGRITYLVNIATGTNWTRPQLVDYVKGHQPGAKFEVVPLAC